MKKILYLLLLGLVTILNFNILLCAEELSAEKFKHGNYINTGSFKGGEIADGLDVKYIRWADRNNFERLVFDIYKWGGPTSPGGILPNEYPGTFKFEFVSEREIDVSFEGYRAFTAGIPKFEKSDLVSEIKILLDEENASESGFKIKIYFKQPVKIEVFQLYSPARIVVDMIIDGKE